MAKKESKSRGKAKSGKVAVPAARKPRASASDRESSAAAISRKMAEDFFKRIREIKAANPEPTQIIDSSERNIQKCLWNIRNAIDDMKREEAELVRILVSQGIYKATDEILLTDLD